MARIILTELEMNGKEYGKILVDTTSKFSDSFNIKKRVVKEPDGKIYFVKETLEEINQMIFEAEMAERNASVNYKKQEIAMEKSVQIQDEMLEIMKYFVKKFE